jgi:hypothetical protein
MALDFTTIRPAPERPKPEHLGDGVYASFDGYHVNIAVNHHTNHVASLDPHVCRGLEAYIARCRKAG